MPNRKIDILACEIDVLGRRGYAKVDVRMSFSKAAKPNHEPFCSKVR